MKRLLCWLDGFAGTWLDPGMWRLRLAGFDVAWSGHLGGPSSFQVLGDREHEWQRCSRCGTERYVGWRRMA